jgi:hypothetical protein
VSDIKVGDLVQVVRTCCLETVAGKWIYQVVAIDPNPARNRWFCDDCGQAMPMEPMAESETTMQPLSWLKRIKPLDELERDQIVKELSI